MTIDSVHPGYQEKYYQDPEAHPYNPNTTILDYLSTFDKDSQAHALFLINKNLIVAMTSNLDNVYDFLTSNLTKLTKSVLFHNYLAIDQQTAILQELIRRENLASMPRADARLAFKKLYSKLPTDYTRRFLNEIYTQYNINQYIDHVHDLAFLIQHNTAGKSNLGFMDKLVGIDKIRSIVKDYKSLNHIFNLLLRKEDIKPFIFNLFGIEHFKKTLTTCADISKLTSIPINIFKEIIPNIYTQEEMKELIASCPPEDTYYAAQILKYLPDEWHKDLFNYKVLQNNIQHPLVFYSFLDNISPNHRLAFFNAFDVKWLSSNMIKGELLENYFPPQLANDMACSILRYKTMRLTQDAVSAFQAKDHSKNTENGAQAKISHRDTMDINKVSSSTSISDEEMEEIQGFIENTRLETDGSVRPNTYSLNLFSNNIINHSSPALLTNGQNSKGRFSSDTPVNTFVLLGAVLLLPLLGFFVYWLKQTYKRISDDKHFQLPFHTSHHKKHH